MCADNSKASFIFACPSAVADLGGLGEVQGMLWLHSAAVTFRDCGSCTFDIRAMWARSWAAGTAGLPGCRLGLSYGTGGQMPALPLGARDSGYWSHFPPQPVPPAHLLHTEVFPQRSSTLGGGRNTQFLSAHLSRVKCLPGFPQCCPDPPVPRGSNLCPSFYLK